MLYTLLISVYNLKILDCQSAASRGNELAGYSCVLVYSKKKINKKDACASLAPLCPTVPKIVKCMTIKVLACIQFQTMVSCH